MAPESREGTQLGHFFSKQGKFFSRNRIAKKLLQFLDKGSPNKMQWSMKPQLR